MIKFFATIVAILALAACGASEQGDQANTAPVYSTFHIGIDNSDSNLIASDQDFARVVARRLADHIAQLPPGTFVSVRTFGDINAANNLRYDQQILPRSYPARQVAQDLARIIDTNIREAGEGQASTEIIATLNWGEYDCAAGDTILLLSDGIPSGQITSQLAVLNGEEDLPQPAPGSLQGCSLTIWGLGRTADGNVSSVQIDNLRSAYTNWANAAGAQFEAITNP